MKWLIDISIYSTVTAALILLIKNIFKDKMSAKWHYYIWVILLIRFFIPSLPQSNISIFNNMPTGDNVKVRQILIESIPTLKPNYITGNAGVNNTHMQFAVQKISIDYVFYIWIIGAVLLFSYFVFVYISFSSNIKNMKECDKNILDLLEVCKNKLSIKNNIKVVMGGDSPMLKGIFRPVIILPQGYTERETKDIFIHELCHYKYGDVFAIWIGTIILCINWFNPIIWYSFFVMRKDIELACDQRVLEIVEDRKEYANLLLKTALRRNRFMLGTTSMQNGEKEISKRIKYIAYFKKPKVYWSIIALVTALAVGGVCLTNAMSSKKTITPKTQSILQYKTAYVGDASKVGNILANLKVPNGVNRNGMELRTTQKPYGIIINYSVDDNNGIIKEEKLDTLQFYRNSAIIFSLVDNADEVFVNLKNPKFVYELKYTRQDIEKYFKTDITSFSKDEVTFNEYLGNVNDIEPENRMLAVDNANIFNIYKADDQLTYLYKAGSYFVKKETMTKELPDIIKNEYGIDVKKMSIKGTTLIVDLNKGMEIELNRGSANATYKLSVLYKSLLERDNVKAVKVLIDGKAGLEGDHYSFRKPAVLGSDGRTDVERYFQVQP